MYPFSTDTPTFVFLRSLLWVKTHGLVHKKFPIKLAGLGILLGNNPSQDLERFLQVLRLLTN